MGTFAGQSATPLGVVFSFSKPRNTLRPLLSQNPETLARRGAERVALDAARREAAQADAAAAHLAPQPSRAPAVQVSFPQFLFTVLSSVTFSSDSFPVFSCLLYVEDNVMTL